MTEATKNPNMNPPIRLYYRRCRFSVQLPHDRIYTADHYWMQQESPGIWRVGLTPWVVRMLGDFREYRCDVVPGAAVKLNQPLGTLKGLQGVAKIRAVVAGSFLHDNPGLVANLEAISQDCYGTGWLCLIQGSPDPETRDAMGYRLLLDESVDAEYGAGPQLQ